jgi:hypothetical protein
MLWTMCWITQHKVSRPLPQMRETGQMDWLYDNIVYGGVITAPSIAEALRS